MTRIHVPLPVRWGDQDPYGHVNNVMILRLLEEARIRVFWLPDPRDTDAVASGTGPLAVLDATGGATQHLVSSHRIDYLVPMPYIRGEFDIQMWIGRLTGAAMDIYYEIHDPVGHEPDTTYVRAMTTCAFFDPATNRLRRITDEERAAWEPFIDEPLAFRR